MLGDLCTSAKTLLRGEILCLYSITATNLVDANACMKLEYSFDCLIVITNLFVLMIHLSVHWVFGAFSSKIVISKERKIYSLYFILYFID